MQTYQCGNAIVRIHNAPGDMEKFKAATAQFLKKVEKQRRRKAKNEGA
jgi:hypothetical protein